MRRDVAALLVVLLMFVTVWALLIFTVTQPPRIIGTSLPVLPGTTGISTSGEGRVKAKPDVVLISIGVTTQAERASDAQQQLAVRVKRVLAAARGLGVPEADIETGAYSIQPQYGYGPTPRSLTPYGSPVPPPFPAPMPPDSRPAGGSGAAEPAVLTPGGVTSGGLTPSAAPDLAPEYPERTGPPRIVRYQATQQIDITYRVVENAGKALDALVQDDFATSATARFGLSDAALAKAQNEARRLAVADAKARATILVEAAGTSLGAVQNISDLTAGRPTYYMGRESAMFSKDGSGASAPSSELPLTDVEIVSQVSVQYALR